MNSKVNRSSDLTKSGGISGSRSKISHVQGTIHRDASPSIVSRILVGRGINLSPSPFRRGAEDLNESDATLRKEFQQYKAHEKQLAERITLLKQEMASLKKIIFKNENDIKLRTAKLDNEKDKILENLVTMVGKKQIVLTGSEMTIGSSMQIDKSQKQLNSTLRSNSMESSARVTEDKAYKVNKTLKSGINNNHTMVSSTLRALARSANLS